MKALKETLILLDEDNDHIQVGEKKIWIDTTWNPEKHRPVSGHVLETHKDSDCQRGDRVYFHYLALDNARDAGKKWQAKYVLDVEDENTLFFAEDHALFVSIRNDEINKDLEGLSTKETFKRLRTVSREQYEDEGRVIMLNGFLLCEPVEPKEQIETSLIIPEMLKQKESKDYARVVFKGKTPKGQMDEVEEGDVVMLTNSGAIPMEYGLYTKFRGGDQRWFRVPRKNIEGIVK